MLILHRVSNKFPQGQTNIYKMNTKNKKTGGMNDEAEGGEA